MKNSKFQNYILVLAIFSVIITSCQKENNEPIATEIEVAFAIQRSDLKNSEGFNLADATKIMLTITNSDDSPTKYTDSEIKIEQINGLYYTKKIVLKTGSYKLTEFLILDGLGATIFATPLAGSPEAQNVDYTLPLAFSVTKNATTPVSVQVLSTEKKTPEDFGLNHFPIVEVKTFGFMVGVVDNVSGEIITADLTVSSGLYSYNQDLDAILNNVVTVKDNLTDYTLKVEKPDYLTYNQTFTLLEIKDYLNEIGKEPLLIELEKGVTDFDGNNYRAVTIGTQTWMKENLKSTHYADGTAITEVYTYNSNPANAEMYGRLYSWNATMKNTNIESTQGVCPTGWHVPSDAEWTELTNTLGGESVAGGKMKEAGLAHWNNPNTGATNESGFTALPAGLYGSNSQFMGKNTIAFFWTSSDYNGFDKWVRYISYDSNIAYRAHAFAYGHSVRCVKD